MGSNQPTTPFYEKQVVVRQASDFDQPLKDGFNYFLDGVIDLTGSGVSLQLVNDGVSSISGYDFRTSGLICDDDNYTLFENDSSTSGTLIISNFYIEIDGANSKVYDIEGDNGTEELWSSFILYKNCSSLGTIKGFKQAVEQDTDREGGTPQLILDGTWSRGYFIDVSVARQLIDGNYFLYKAGPTFSMSSRFRSNQNLDLNSNIGFFDFSASNFTADNLVQLRDCIITRNGVSSPVDSTIIPNIGPADSQTSFINNTGIRNTHAGGKITVSSASTTTINSGSTFVPLEGIFTSSGLQHFDTTNQNKRLRNISTDPVEFSVYAYFQLESTANNVLALRLKKVNPSTGFTFVFVTQTAQVTSSVGNRDVATFSIQGNVLLEKNSYITIEVANNNGNNNITAEVGGYVDVTER